MQPPKALVEKQDTSDSAVLVVDDEPASVDLIDVTLGRDHRVYTATDGKTALALLAAHPEIAVAIIDQRMPGMSGTELIQQTVELYPHLVRVILTGYTDIESLIEAINAGRVYRYLTKPWNKDELLGVVRQGLEVHRLAVENDQLQHKLRAANERLRFENAILKREAKGRYRFDEIIGKSPALLRTLDTVEHVIDKDTKVLILGETGTGKELIARAIHYNGPRANEQFLTVNCAAFSPDLLASELFGHKKGGFTGAHEDRQGLFRAADGGTLFLDEIGDCAAGLQAQLLRTLDQGEVRRIGEDKPFKVDVRVIAATNKDLEEEVRAGRFRADLMFRLSVFKISLPPLRERREDIPVLAHHFLRRFSERNSKPIYGFTEECLTRLSAYGFPGNVRELENEVEWVFTIAKSHSYVTPELLSPKFHTGDLLPTINQNGTLIEAVAQCEIQHIVLALERNGGSRIAAAKDLGIARETLFAKLKKYGIN